MNVLRFWGNYRKEWFSKALQAGRVLRIYYKEVYPEWTCRITSFQLGCFPWSKIRFEWRVERKSDEDQREKGDCE